MNSEKEKKSKENETLTHPIGQTKKSNQDLNSIGEQGTKKTVKPHPQTLTLIPKSDEIRAQELKKLKGEEGEGGGLPRRCAALLSRRRAGKRKGRPGALLARIQPQGRRGQAARRRRAHPLGSAHAGEGASDGAGTSLLRRCRSLGV